MKVFKEPNTSNGWKCMVCGKSDKKEVVLIGITGTENDGIIEAEQVHLGCLDLLYDKGLELFYQRVKRKEHV